MFIKKDLRKIPKILEEAVICPIENEDNNEDNDESTVVAVAVKKPKLVTPLTHLKLGRRHQEFRGGVDVLCRLEYLPKLRCLQQLNLYDCGISSLDGIGILDGRTAAPALEHLNLGRNPLTTLPDELASLTQLKELWLDDCQLQGAIPSCVWKLPKLEAFKAPNNQLTALFGLSDEDGRNSSSSNNHTYAAMTMTCFGQTACRHTLKVLVLDRNPLGQQSQQRLPHDWNALTTLQELYLRHTELTTIPTRLPPKLQILHLSSNPLTNIDSIMMMSSNSTSTSSNSNTPELKQLVLNGCQLTHLPDGLVSHRYHPDLERLQISHNPSLTQLPMDIWHAIRGRESLGTGPTIVWQPNPQLLKETSNDDGDSSPNISSDDEDGHNADVMMGGVEPMTE